MSQAESCWTRMKGGHTLPTSLGFVTWFQKRLVTSIPEVNCLYLKHLIRPECTSERMNRMFLVDRLLVMSESYGQQLKIVLKFDIMIGFLCFNILLGYARDMARVVRCCETKKCWIIPFRSEALANGGSWGSPSTWSSLTDLAVWFSSAWVCSLMCWRSWRPHSWKVPWTASYVHLPPSRSGRRWSSYKTLWKSLCWRRSTLQARNVKCWWLLNIVDVLWYDVNSQ